MSDEALNEAVVTVPESESATAPETAENESSQDGGDEAPPKTFTQEELDAAVGKRLAKERRAWERQQADYAQEAQRAASRVPPSSDQFESVADYVEALADHRAQELVTERDNRKQETQVQSAFDEREDESRVKYHDYDDVVQRLPRDGGPAISNEMAAVIKSSDIGPEIAYYLGKNTEESARIYRLDPLMQAREITKLEISLSTNPPAKKVSSAPEPIRPVGSRSSTPTYSTSDPRSAKSMDTSDWINARNQELANKHRA